MGERPSVLTRLPLSGRANAPPSLGNSKPALSEGLCDWLTTSPMGAPGSFPPPLAPSSNSRALATAGDLSTDHVGGGFSALSLRPAGRPIKRRRRLEEAAAHRVAGFAGLVGPGRCSEAGSRSCRWLEGASVTAVFTAGRAAAGSGAAFESPAPGRLCTLAPCLALGPRAAPADLCTPRVPGRRAQLFGKGAA